MEKIDLTALIPIFAGVYLYLIASGAIPKNPRDPEKLELWRRKFGKWATILGPLVVIFGVLQFFRIL